MEVPAHRSRSFVLEVPRGVFSPFVFGPVATTPLRYDPPYEWPTLGSTSERNGITRGLTRVLGNLCEIREIAFVSIFEDLINSDLQTRAEFDFDGVHLGPTACPLFVQGMRE